MTADLQHDGLWVIVVTPERADASHPADAGRCWIGDASSGPNCPLPRAYRITLASAVWGDDGGPGPVTFACPKHTAMMRAQRSDLTEVRSCNR